MSDDRLDEELWPFRLQVWHPGQLLAFSGIDGVTDYAAGLVIRTVQNPAGLEIVHPACLRITFVDPRLAEVVVTSDVFSVRSGSGRVAGCMLDAHHLLISGEVTVSGDDSALCHHAKGDRHLLGPVTHFDARLIDTELPAAMAARYAWILGQPMVRRSSGQTGRAVFKALSVMKGQVSTPDGVIRHRWTTPDRWPHKDMWLWDSVFHAIGWRHVDPALAREMIDAVFDGQRADGFIPHQLSPAHGPSPITQPPLLAYGISLIDAVSPDSEWMRQHYPKLSAYVAWDLANRDRDGDGLAEWLIEGDPVSRSGESGMDNSPRFDFHYPTRLAVTDFNAYLALECETLAGFADRLGLVADASQWRSRYAGLCRRINDHLWSGEDQFYCDYDSSTGSRSSVLASAGFLPLICGAPTPERAAALARHLRDPALFGTAFPVPSIAARDHVHYAKDMWRGPSWVNINWLIARGLERYAPFGKSFTELAHALDHATRREIERTVEVFGTFFEYFDDRLAVEPPRLLRKGVCDPGNPFRQVIHDYGWTTTLYLDLVARAERPSPQ